MRFKAFSKRRRLTKNGTLCFRLGSFGHLCINNIFMSPTAAGIFLTYWGPFWNKLPTWPRNSHWPVACNVKIRTICWIGDKISSSKNVKESVSGNGSPGSAKFLAVSRTGSFDKPSAARRLASNKQFSQIGRPASSHSGSEALRKSSLWRNKCRVSGCMCCCLWLAQTVRKFGKVDSFAAPILVVVFWLPMGVKFFTRRNQKEFLVAVSGFPIW